jgi:hypothetical protein
MVLNSIGVYGFLSRAHIEHALAGDVKTSFHVATVAARLDAKQASASFNDGTSADVTVAHVFQKQPDGTLKLKLQTFN